MPLSLKSVRAARGVRWIRDGFALFARRPLAFTAMFVWFLLAVLVVSFVPLLGAIAQLMVMPLLTLGFMIASQSALLDGPVKPTQFIEPLRGDAQHRRALLTLCAIYGACALLIFLLVDLISDGAIRRFELLYRKGAGADELAALASEGRVQAAALVATVLGTALTVPFWHAPALVYWGGQGVGQSLFSSALAVWRSRGAFLLYGLGWLVLGILFGLAGVLMSMLIGARQLASVLAVPAGLVLSTVFYVSLLFAFNDSFGGTQALPPEA